MEDKAKKVSGKNDFDYILTNESTQVRHVTESLPFPFLLPPKRCSCSLLYWIYFFILNNTIMEDDQQQFDKDDYTGLDGQNGENFEQQENTEQSVEDGGDQAMETGGEQSQDGADDNEDERYERKIFVGGLSWETTTKDLREYFEKFGEVTSCTLKTDVETRQSRGFGFVVFKSTETVQKVLDTKEHKLHGRNIDPKPANPRQGIKKIFVGRLDPGVPEDDVKAYFGTFGTVAKIDFPYDKVKEQRRAFCFVEFESDAAVKKVLEQETHKLGGQEVDVKKATPNANQPGGGGRGGRGGRGWGGGPGFGGPRGRGRGGWNQGGNWNQGGGYGYGGYGNYGGYGQGGYGNYGGYGGYGGYGNDYYGYGQGGWDGYGQGYGYGGYEGYDYGGWGYGQDEGNSSYGKTQKRGGHSGGYHPYNR